ncbi:head vertex protein [Aeromonas phage phiAS5]|uniref:Head vertex protein n=1 Tax=Aeromonas phage phiAS5 TaxID=879630 RepID=E1A2B7_9CAUD|nr:head vertex protein [Aeromonas phage phiAS5]ADM79863.1 head vertex protein [Aeromonas phage phiAS5]
MLKDLIAESSGSSGIDAGRPSLVALTRKTQDLIYKDLVCVQPTKHPMATVYGMRLDYVAKDGSVFDIQLDHRTHGGKFKIGYTGLASPATNNVVGDQFQYNSYAFEVIKAGDYVTGYTTEEDYHRSMLRGDLRLLSDGIDYATEQDGQEIVPETQFVLNRWSALVRSRKMKCPITIELVQDMERDGLNADNTIEDLLATSIATEINSDIISKLMCVSTKEPELSLVNYETTYYQGRELITRACIMASEIEWYSAFEATYCLVSYKVYGIILASGQVDERGYIKGTKMKLMMDSNAIVDYMMVGTKVDGGENSMDNASGVFYSPYQEGDEAGTFLVTSEPGALQPVVGVISRYALSCFPDYADVAKSAKPSGEDWQKVANKSIFVRLTPVVVE